MCQSAVNCVWHDKFVAGASFMNIVGTTQPIHDASEKAAGRVVYAGDMALPGMRHIAMLWSPVPHALVKAIHTEKTVGIKSCR